MKVKLGNFYFKQAEIKIGSETIIGSESKIAGTNLGFFVYVSLYRCIGYTDEWIF